MRHVLIALCLLALTGCMTSMGQPIDHAQLDQIEEGVTTKPELVAMFGRPMMVGVGSDGTTILTWSHANAGIWGAQKAQGLSVNLDDTGTVASYHLFDMEPPNR